MIEQALGDIAQAMARYGSASGVDDFANEQTAEDFRDALAKRYPPQGYGTWTSRASLIGHRGRYAVTWRVYSAD